MDPHKISKALDNHQNEIILSLSSKKIKELNLKIINELYLPKKNALECMKKLDGYRYVDEINDLKNGAYIRWINITDHSNLRLSRGATVCDIKISDKGTFINCKNSYGNSHFNILMDSCLVFQKLTDEENIILSVVNYLDK